MAKGYILYNPIAGKGDGDTKVTALNKLLSDPLEFYDVTKIEDYSSFLSKLEAEDYLVVAGGDGTLNRFINNTASCTIAQDILYYPIGSGNDFARELGTDDTVAPVSIKTYLADLPAVEVNGKKYHFLNGVGYGIDGYCCQVGDELRAIPGKKVDYTGIAIKGLLFHFKRRNAKITVDGQKYCYDKVWLAPTMHGKYYGGGMIPTPGQDRNDPAKSLSILVFHNGGRLRTLIAFPGIFKGEHIKHKNMVKLHSGHCIQVEFDQPTPLQIDGETILDVTSYTAYSPAYLKNEEKTPALV